MSTRRSGTPAKDSDAFPTTQLLLLSLVRVSEPIAITSIFPYAWKFVKHLEFGNPKDASFYAGILIASFALAEACTSFLWGLASDRYGRKPVLLFGCCGSILSLLVVGFSTNFWVAIIGRSLGGLLNGNQGVIQTMVAELVRKPEHEPKAYAVMPFVWSVGTMLGPAVGGFFAEPYRTFPQWFSADGFWGRYPYLLPNLVCAALLAVAVVLGIFMIDETHPDMQGYSSVGHIEEESTVDDHRPLLATAAATDHAPVDLRSECYGTFNNVEVHQNEKPSSDKAFTGRVVMLIVALGIFTYHSMCFDVLTPIFFQDRRGDSELVVSSSDGDALSGGLGLSTQDVGLISFVNGFIALFIQAVIFPLAAEWLGIWRSFLVVTIGHPLAYAIVPFLTFIPASSSGTLTMAIYGCLTVRNLFGILAYPLVLILIKEASPGPASLGRINGLAASTGAACRTIASPVAGALYTAGIQSSNTALPWIVTAVVAVVGVVQVFFIGRQKNEPEVHVQSAVAHVGRRASVAQSQTA